ncbi:hypothetical protein L0Z14_29300 [Burkholderia multivorans]|nr:hypothetical protein [Burkholderia multivorans]MCL4664997.1 hypothetical protein [Burkholderia multivorans]MCO1415448.1 hypothetical protein [Burkholderia multivorans]
MRTSIVDNCKQRVRHTVPVQRVAIAKHDQKVGVSRDFAGYGTTQVGVTAGIQQRF